MKPFTTLAVVVFSVVAAVHLLRLALGWAVTIDGLVVPMWVSVLGAVIAAAFAYALWREAARR